MPNYEVYVDDVQLGTPQALRATLQQIKATLNQYAQQGWELVAVEQLETTNKNMVVMVHYLRK